MLATIYQAKLMSDGSLFDSDQVFSLFVQTRSSESVSEVMQAFTRVAELNLDTHVVEEILDRAFERTNSIDGYWGDNEDVTVLGRQFDSYRSTSVGDIVSVLHFGGRHLERQCICPHCVEAETKGERLPRVTWHVVAKFGWDLVGEHCPMDDGRSLGRYDQGVAEADSVTTLFVPPPWVQAWRS